MRKALLAFLLVFAAAVQAAPWDGTRNGITVYSMRGHNWAMEASAFFWIAEIGIHSDDPTVTSFRVDITYRTPDGSLVRTWQLAEVDPQLGWSFSAFFCVDLNDIQTLRITARKDVVAAQFLGDGR